MPRGLTCESSVAVSVERAAARVLGESYDAGLRPVKNKKIYILPQNPILFIKAPILETIEP